MIRRSKSVCSTRGRRGNGIRLENISKEPSVNNSTAYLLSSIGTHVVESFERTMERVLGDSVASTGGELSSALRFFLAGIGNIVVSG